MTPGQQKPELKEIRTLNPEQRIGREMISDSWMVRLPPSSKQIVHRPPPVIECTALKICKEEAKNA